MYSVETCFPPPSDVHPEFNNDDYISSNLALLHIYYNKRLFMRNERGELFGIIDLFSNIGGLLGLCMGFSALSALEFFYFFSARLYFNIKLPRKESL